MKNELKLIIINFTNRMWWSLFLTCLAGVSAGFYWESVWLGLLIGTLAHYTTAPEEFIRK